MNLNEAVSAIAVRRSDRDPISDCMFKICKDW